MIVEKDRKVKIHYNGKTLDGAYALSKRRLWVWKTELWACAKDKKSNHPEPR